MTKRIKKARSVTKKEIESFRNLIELNYRESGIPYAGFDEILCYELHSQPINPRMIISTSTGKCTGLTFKELANKWGISLPFLGKLIRDHCEKL